jgi:hypothetical protein
MAISEEELLLILQQKFPNAKIKLKDLIFFSNKKIKQERLKGDF